MPLNICPPSHWMRSLYTLTNRQSLLVAWTSKRGGGGGRTRMNVTWRRRSNRARIGDSSPTSSESSASYQQVCLTPCTLLISTCTYAYIMLIVQCRHGRPPIACHRAPTFSHGTHQRLSWSFSPHLRVSCPPARQRFRASRCPTHQLFLILLVIIGDAPSHPSPTEYTEQRQRQR